MPPVSRAVIFAHLVLFLPCVCGLPRFSYAENLLFAGSRDVFLNEVSPAISLGGELIADDVVSIEIRESEDRAGLAAQEQQQLLEDLILDQARFPRHSLRRPTGSTKQLSTHEGDDSQRKEGNLETSSEAEEYFVHLDSVAEKADVESTAVPEVVGSAAEGHVMKPRQIVASFKNPATSESVLEIVSEVDGVRDSKSAALGLEARSNQRKRGEKTKSAQRNKRKGVSGDTRKMLKRN